MRMVISRPERVRRFFEERGSMSSTKKAVAGGGAAQSATNSVMKPVDSFNFFDPEVLSSPFDFYQAMHAQCPVYKVPDRNIYIVSKYADVESCLRAPETFSSSIERATLLQDDENSKAYVGILKSEGWEHVPTLQRADPPQHARYRKIVDGALNVREVRELQPRLDRLAAELVDKFIDRGEVDFIEEFALPFPGIIAAELIGLDARDYKRFTAWADNLQQYGAGKLTRESIEASARMEVEMQKFFAGIFEDRRKAPREDLMTALLMAYEGDAPLSMHELQNMMHQLISAGYETVKSALAHGMWQMVRFPEVVAELRADRHLLPRFINESLRWESPVQGLWRIVKQDVGVAGTTIPKGALCSV
ncbi:MAG: cytochrome P450, partial [Betaproteobacteria bacterium]|nr:cytochrome P450 [Betaproteobacteria bacterium]